MLKDSVFWWREAKPENDNFVYRRSDGFGVDGYDENGFDRDGFDVDGYDENGFDRDGFDAHGINRWGFDRYGDDARFPYRDSEGYDRGGFDRNGYDREGFDREGFDVDGYNRQGYDRFGYTREEVEEETEMAKEQEKISKYIRLKEYQEWHEYDNQYKKRYNRRTVFSYSKEDGDIYNMESDMFELEPKRTEIVRENEETLRFEDSDDTELPF